MREKLSRQEVNVAMLVADGYSDKQIEAMLNISHNAVRIYIDRVRKKWELAKDRNVRTEITRIVVRIWADYEYECLTNEQQARRRESA